MTLSRYAIKCDSGLSWACATATSRRGGAKEGNASGGINAGAIILEMHEDNILLEACFSQRTFALITLTCTRHTGGAHRRRRFHQYETWSYADNCSICAPLLAIAPFGVPSFRLAFSPLLAPCRLLDDPPFLGPELLLLDQPQPRSCPAPSPLSSHKLFCDSLRFP